MPLPVITDTLRVATEGATGHGVNWANVLHFRKTPILTYVGAIAILDPLLFALFNAALGGGTPWKVSAATTASLQRFRYTPLDGISASTITPHVLAGTAAVDELPSNVALVASLHTAKRGRSYRGRCYWVGWGENVNVAPGVPNPGNVTGMATQWNGFITSLGGTGLTLVVASYLHATADDVTNVTVDSRWDSQRRRLG